MKRTGISNQHTNSPGMANHGEHSALRERWPRSRRLIHPDRPSRHLPRTGDVEQPQAERRSRLADVCFQNILVPVDFSRESTRALKFAVAFARRDAARLVLVHVVGPIYYLRDYGLGPVPRRRVDETLVRQSRQRLRSLTRRHIRSDVKWKSVVCSGTAPRQILMAAEEHSADLIVMPTRGLSHGPPAEIGSTAERVVRHARCPVLVLSTISMGKGRQQSKR